MRNLKLAKNAAEKAMELLLSKYNADEFTIDCEKMSDDDFVMFKTLDECIEILGENIKSEINK